MKYLIKSCTVLILGALLSACGSSSDSSSTSSNVSNRTGGFTASTTGPDGSQGSCDEQTSGVNWNALMTENCDNLADYNLFQDPSVVTENPEAGGLEYDLSMPLFTDYASKYRFVFIPTGEQVNYSEHEVLEFPVGSVLVKTFAMPEDTAFRGENELIIETRLLIHRQDGWKALPYYWETPTEAKLAITGKSINNMNTLHNGEELDFTYQVPKASSCTSCHAIVPILTDSSDKRTAIFKPIGPKARFLNSEHDYQGSSINQLVYWQEQGVLDGLPSDFSLITQLDKFTDATDISALNEEELNTAAKAYLDINCAHCHRSNLSLEEDNYAGAAGGSGLNVEFNREYNEDTTKFGTCKVPVAGGHEDYPYDVIPQDSANSYLLFRMSTNEQRHRMPELGRATVHKEGVELIRSWIDNLATASCTPVM